MNKHSVAAHYFWLITGYTGCGKDTCAEALRDELGFHLVSMSRFMQNHGFDHHRAANIDESLRMRDDFLEKHPPEECVNFILHDLEANGALAEGKLIKPVVMAGLRTIAIFELLQQRVPVRTIALLVDEEERFRRIHAKSRRQSDPQSRDELRRLTIWEDGRGQHLMIRNAEFRVDASDSKSRVRDALFQIVSEPE